MTRFLPVLQVTTGAFADFPPTGKRIVGAGVDIFHFENSKILELCVYWGDIGLLK